MFVHSPIIPLFVSSLFSLFSPLSFLSLFLLHLYSLLSPIFSFFFLLPSFLHQSIFLPCSHSPLYLFPFIPYSLFFSSFPSLCLLFFFEFLSPFHQFFHLSLSLPSFLPPSLSQQNYLSPPPPPPPS